MLIARNDNRIGLDLISQNSYQFFLIRPELEKYTKIEIQNEFQIVFGYIRNPIFFCNGFEWYPKFENKNQNFQIIEQNLKIQVGSNNSTSHMHIFF